MKISYAITVCNELEEIQRLLNFLYQHKRPKDEICVLLDKPKASQQLIDELYYWSSKDIITLKESTFQGHFADWKNELNRICSGNYIFQIDADEIPPLYLINHLDILLEQNPTIDLFLVPRINIVDGLTQEHINKWRWNINEYGWVNWPDFQTRIYRNSSEIKWINRVHEKLEGYKEFSILPETDDWALYHPKIIERQEKQNGYYNTL
jgi:hypothetical protein